MPSPTPPPDHDQAPRPRDPCRHSRWPSPDAALAALAPFALWLADKAL